MSDVSVELNVTHTVRVGAPWVQAKESKKCSILTAGLGPRRETDFKILFFTFPPLIKVKTCKPALGHSFAAGTIDGVGAFNFTQGNLESKRQYGFVQMGRTRGVPQIGEEKPQSHTRAPKTG